ncbi:GPW/gp25 family protein [Mucilaginibacter sp. RS28]|uniref:GPW/gp25 family protein n=1 Tax=Mucilaginibacter straminoryzae TaxID=2932774 RepID=A0A9X1WZK1_9SPHI|nr:GPW/gp25 family protein [Mucilaginibacter straminoryzae]MCJ8208328.1 GPW/gp25 family protein [Mucilaginibacter straminoryzae]
MASNIQSFLGTGWGFPPTFDKVSNGVRMSSDMKDIEESIWLILGTIPGERIMQPEFGCDLRKMGFERIDSNLVSSLNHVIYHALLNFEPRVNFTGADVLGRDDADGILTIQINYTIISTNTRHNIVYPFYLVEGTNLSAAAI